MNISDYAQAIRQKFDTGQAREHAYRPILESLMKSFTDVDAVNEPKRSAYGNPDLVFLKKSHQAIILGYAEAKDIDKDLDKVEKSEQLHRYSGYENLYLTNYLEFRFYQNGNRYQSIKIGEFANGKIIFFPDKYSQLEQELAAFLTLPPESIKSGKRLAQIMGAKGHRIRDNVAEYLSANSTSKNEELEKIYAIMQALLVHDLTPEKFADMYAQTLVYGLFVARYSDKSPESFTRQEARDLVPKSNPFLQKFFDHIVGPDFVTSLGYIVDELCEIFSVSNVAEIVHKHLKILDDTGEKDPIIHFYEDFLKEYDPAERKKMGAYYTPVPVVQFIVRQVDRILKEDFGIVNGLADSTKTTRGNKRDKYRGKITEHKVQILDPAVGTATFLNEIIKYVRRGFDGQEGRWQNYVKEDLLPRLYGFELMMAPYTIAHLKLGMTLQETGVTDLTRRLGVYLTNTLEEGLSNQINLDMALGLSSAVAEEASQAGVIKHERPIMVVMGNPPYSGVSSNETKFANALIDKYKVEPGGKQKLQERKHWLNDDYVKFIAFAEDMIERKGTGVVAMITNNGYLDNPTFRGMRWHLAKTFDKIYVLDLHGNAKKKETAPDGSKDQNVFDIMQGVGIILAVKTGKKSDDELAKVYHADSYGTRQAKFDELGGEIDFAEVQYDEKSVYFVPKDTEGEAEYMQNISVDKLFPISSTGIFTLGDDFIVTDDKNSIEERVKRVISRVYSQEDINSDFSLGKNYARWITQDVNHKPFDESLISEYTYRPFETKTSYFDKNFIWRVRETVTKHMLKDNLALSVGRQGMAVGSMPWNVCFVTDSMVDLNLFYRGGEQVMPLYLYHEDGTRTANFAPAELSALTRQLSGEPSPEDVLDYTYAVLHSPSYRAKYKEFLKIDFPRVPAPTQAEFDRLVPLGRSLRQLHLMKSPIIEQYDTTYPSAGTNVVGTIHYSLLKKAVSQFTKPGERVLVQDLEPNAVYINEKQYFGNVPQLAWEFYIGGYQPAQKWLKDRKSRELSSDDIVHYQKIIKVLVETDRIMKEIDDIWKP